MKPKEVIQILKQFCPDEEITFYNTNGAESSCESNRLIYGDGDNLEISQKTPFYPILPYCKFFFSDLRESEHAFSREADLSKNEDIFVWFTPKKTYIRIGVSMYVSSIRDIPSATQFIKGIV